MRIAFTILLIFTSFVVNAEGGCPPGQYPIGGQGVQGCAPISGGAGGGTTSAPRPTGKWDTRWGAIAEDSSTLSTGTSVSQKSKREATAAAIKDCERGGGLKCKLTVAYHNQCVAIADPTIESRKRLGGENSQSIHAAAETVEQAKSNAMNLCGSFGKGQDCSIVYSACSMSEFRSF